jgi:hypothetical protein
MDNIGSSYSIGVWYGTGDQGNTDFAVRLGLIGVSGFALQGILGVLPTMMHREGGWAGQWSHLMGNRVPGLPDSLPALASGGGLRSRNPLYSITRILDKRGGLEAKKQPPCVGWSHHQAA